MTYNQQIYQPRLSNTTHISMPHTNFNDGHVRYELMNVNRANNIVPNTSKVESVGVNHRYHIYRCLTVANTSVPYWFYQIFINIPPSVQIHS